MNAPHLSTGGTLELGRHPVTLEDARLALVDDSQFATSISRAAIWQHFESANALLQSAVVVHSAWIGGSFTTTKTNPRDIDVVYVVNEADRASRPDDDLQVIESFQLRDRDPLTGRSVPRHGLLVDSFLLNWSPHVDSLKDNASYRDYALMRGYWDDFWQRQRSGGKKASLVAADALPRRGYLEVQFSGYTA